MDRCPHCGHNHRDRSRGDFLVMCPDQAPWTDEEKDAWRAQVRRRDPAARFVGKYDYERVVNRANNAARRS